MKLSQFQFQLSLKNDVAHEPTAKWRDESRMMVLHKDTGEIEHKIFKNITDYFGKGDTFVLNDTKFSRQDFSERKRRRVPTLRYSCSGNSTKSRDSGM